MGQRKISLVYDNMYYSKDRFKIPENVSTQTYVENTIKEFNAIVSELYCILFDFGDGTYAYKSKFSKEIRYITHWQNVRGYCVTPSILDYHLYDEIKMPYVEYDVLIKHQEMREFLPITSEERIKAFLNFIFNTLSINYHLDNEFEDYLTNGKIKDSSGKTILFTKEACEWFDLLSLICLDIAGDKAYEWGSEILTKMLNLNESEFLHLSQDEELNEISGYDLHDVTGNYDKIIVNNSHWLTQQSDSDNSSFNNLFQSSIVDAKIKKRKMHKILGIPENEDIEDHIGSGKELAAKLIKKVGRKKASQMINYAANISSKHNIFDDAQTALKTIKK